MQRGLVRIMRYLALAVFAVCLLQTASAKRGRDVSGIYQFSSVTESSRGVHLTISLTLRNNSGADISDSGVILLTSEPDPSVLGTFSGMKVLHNYESVTMSQTFTVPKEEYEGWEKGRNPALRLLVEDSNGALITEGIDLQRANGAVK
jgi:hypothetical protein